MTRHKYLYSCRFDKSTKKSQSEKKTMSDEYRKFREMVKAIGRVKAAEIYNKEVVKTAEYKKWKKMMNEKHGDNNA